jgi:hypothetical protein
MSELCNVSFVISFTLVSLDMIRKIPLACLWIARRCLRFIASDALELLGAYYAEGPHLTFILAQAKLCFRCSSID